MPSTSPMQFVVDTLVDLLDDETTFSVVRVWNQDAYNPSKTTVYPYVNGITYLYDTENGTATGEGIASCEILCNAQTESDASGSGITTAKAGVIAQKIKKLFDDKDCETIAVNNDGVYKVRINAMSVDAHVGHMDIGKGRVQIGFAVTVSITQWRV